MEIIEIIICFVSFVATVISGVAFLGMIYDKIFGYPYRAEDWKDILLFFVCLVLPSSLLFFSFFLMPKTETKTEYPASTLVAQEFESVIEYRAKDGSLVYRLTDIKEYKQKQNITGFVRIDKKGWGPDSTNIQPCFNFPEENTKLP